MNPSLRKSENLIFVCDVNADLLLAENLCRSVDASSGKTGSWIMDRGSWIMDHGSWVMGKTTLSLGVGLCVSTLLYLCICVFQHYYICMFVYFNIIMIKVSANADIRLFHCLHEDGTSRDRVWGSSNKN